MSHEHAHYDPYEHGSQASRDTLDEIMDKFRITVSPEVRFKIQKEIGPVKASLNLSTFPLHASGLSPKAAIVLKPTGESSRGWYHVRKIELDTQEKALKVFSNKFRLGPLTTQFSAGHNWGTGKLGMAYRVKFMGPMGIPSDGSMKFKRQLNDNVSARAKLFVDYSLPQLEGRLSNAQDERYQTTDVGSVSVDLNKVDVVFKLDKTKPKAVLAPVTKVCPSCSGAGEIVVADEILV